MIKSICIDARMVKNSGIGVYIDKYCQFFLESDRWTVSIIGSKSVLRTLYGAYDHWHLIEDYTPIYSIREQFMLFRKIPKCDVFWSPHYNIPLLPIPARKRVVTIPDIFHLVYNYTFSFEKRIYAKYVINRAIVKSDIVTTISKFSKNEILKYTHAKSNEVFDIYLGIDLAYFSKINDVHILNNVKERYSISNRFILFVGNVKPHKNLIRLIKSFQNIILNDPSIDLLIVGKKDGFITGGEEVFSLLNSNEELNRRVKFTGYVNDRDLPVIYNLASLFVFPSLYEGFGFPPLEAMACGCPVVASDIASIREVCGNAAYYVNANDIQSISKGMFEMLNKSVDDYSFREKGFDQVRLYNWHKSCSTFENLLYNL